ncbi:MAG: MFS transporter [Spirochaetales bacterium]|nr:MFS transporter [Spirochaetales bacterium]
METFKGPRRFFYNLSNAGQAICDSIILFFAADFFIPPKEKLAIGMPQFLSDQVFLGVLTVVGVVMIFGRIVDAVADPVIASMSDRSKSGLGRRRVFLIFGGLPLAVSTVLIFFPPVSNASWINAIYLAVMSGIYFFFYTVYVAPYIALIPELGHTEKERINLTTVQAAFALVGGVLVLICGPLLISIFSFAGPVGSMQLTIIVLCIIAAVFLYTAVFSVDEKRFSNAQPCSVSLGKSIKTTLKNKPFIIFLVTNMCFWFIFNTVRAALRHIVPTIINASLLNAEGDTSLFNTVIFGSAFIFFILVWLITKKVDKKKIYMTALVSFGLLFILIGLIGILPGDPKIWAYVLFALCGFPVAAFLVLQNVFISELCDKDYHETGERREGMYFGVHGFFVKIVLGLSFATLSFLFLAFGKDIENPFGVRLTVIVAGIVAVIGFLVFFLYPSLKKEGASQA